MIKFIIDPFNILWLMALAAFLLFLLNKRRYAGLTAAACGVWFLLISTPFLPGLMLTSLENRYEPLMTDQIKDPASGYCIVVLGGGHGFDDRLPANSLLSLQALSRLTEGVRLHRQLPNSTLIFSGGSESGRTTQAEMLQKTALLLGVDKERTVLQSTPMNTTEEALAFYNQFEDSCPVILVTSAAHMHRAMGAFRHQSIEPVPSPTHFRIKRDPFGSGSWIPSVTHISNFRVAMREYAALFRDWWLF